MKKLFTLMTLLLCIVVGVKGADTETTTAVLHDWTVNTGTGGTVTWDNNNTIAVINCGSTKGNAVTLTSDISYNEISKIEFTTYLSDRSKTDLKIEIGTITDGVFSASQTFSSTYDSSAKKLTLGTLSVSKNTTNTTGAVTLETATTGYVRITMANASGSTGKTGKYFNVKITAKPKTVTATTLTGIRINGNAWDIAGLSDNTATIATEYAGPPTVQFVYTAEYDDGTTLTGRTEEVEAMMNDGSYKASSTVFANNITLTFTNISNTLFSMSDPTAPTESMDSKTGSDLTATFSAGGSAYVYNGKSSAAVLVDSNNGINLAGSGDSYFMAKFTAKLAAGDVIESSNTTGTFYVWHSNSKSNSVTFPYTIPEESELIGKKAIYVKKNGASTFTWLTITRPKVIASQTLAGVKKGDVTLTETTDYTVSETTITLTEAHKALLAPTNIKLINHISYDDATTEDQDVDVTLAKNEDYFEGTAIIGATTYTVKVPVDTSVPVLTLSASSGSISLNSYTPTGSVKVTLTGSNLTDGTYDAPTVEGVTITPATYTVTDGAANQEFTITSTANTAASTEIVFAYEGAESKTYTLSYSKTAQRGLSQTDVTDATTWDWSKAGSNTIELTANTSPTNAEEFLMANIAEVNNDENFNSQALMIQTQYPTRGSNNYFQGYSIKFNTTVQGTIDVTFSNTGNKRPYRYLRVNGTLTDYRDGDGKMVTATGIFVPAGEVVIDFYIPDATDPQERSGDVVGTTMCRVNKIVFTPVTETTVKIENGTGYRTFASKYPTDWSGVTGVEAYTASVSADKVSFNKVNGKVPAGKGLLLKGADNTYTIPVCATIPDPIQNAFVGILKETDVNETGIFVLMNGAKGVGFYKTTAENFTVGANTAYLPAIAAPGRTFIGFDEETTGISEEIRVKSEESRFYNLNGQRVEKPAKGLYIVNGKKFIVK